jgi:molybdopterin-guanine dinucleotide biosynthesis protein B
MARLPPVVSFVAPSGTGKTTLIEGVLRILAGRDLRIAVVKHDAHRLHLDQPGKDSFRYRAAGAWRAVVASETELGLFSQLDGRSSLGGLVSDYLSEADLVLTEGFRSSSVPAIRVHRSEAEDPSWTHGQVRIIAWASNANLELDVPLLPLDAPEEVADFLVQRLLRRSVERQVTGLIAALEGVEEHAIGDCLDGLRAAGLERLLVIRPTGAAAIPGVHTVSDIRPELGPLGALFTGLAASETPDVLFLNARERPPSPEFLRGLLTWGPRSADVVVPILGERRMPLPGLYGHRCLSAIQASLLSGEGRMDGWWAQVRVHGIPEQIWRPWTTP